MLEFFTVVVGINLFVICLEFFAIRLYITKKLTKNNLRQFSNNRRGFSMILMIILIVFLTQIEHFYDNEYMDYLSESGDNCTT